MEYVGGRRRKRRGKWLRQKKKERGRKMEPKRNFYSKEALLL